MDLMMYEILKILHIVSFVSWFAGLFYLPRLFVYHVENNTNREMNDVFQKMEYKLLRVIMNPAMILTWIFGLGLIHYVGFASWLVLKRSNSFLKLSSSFFFARLWASHFRNYIIDKYTSRNKVLFNLAQ